MGYVASLDMGSETMVMALAERTGDDCRLVGVMSVASQGIKRGKITDKLRAKVCIQQLLDGFESEHSVHIDSLNITLSGSWVKLLEDRESLKYSKLQGVTQHDLLELEKRCKSSLENGDEVVVDVVPMAYFVDKEVVSDPIGCSARRLDVRYQVFVVSKETLEELKILFSSLGVEHLEIYSVVRAMTNALIAKQGENQDFALVDLGAESTKILVFQSGMAVFYSELPLGCRTIEADLNVAFSIRDLEKAKKLKHEYGMALRAECKNRKVIIPETKYCIESHNLAYVEQCRLEEILEGAIFQMQQSGCYESLDEGILLTGGGSRVVGINTLLAKLSGHTVGLARAVNVLSEKGALLKMPEYLTALGLLRCERREQKKSGNRMKRWFGELFND
ncbi:cell division FtsA domain-containing protein [uncultured Sanguibacteroides sp.]|uniref:cell division FtsA domain-containing protein n=1 Tax=uncultured Sanguibacteroides sp. TaxID=1635151 RepID=UPI0025E96E06|nr:cell division FtsA domain-containing protein [uncultured Sanguibacteroides sp.]